ncbi:MAG: chemotaxis protein CheD [Chloroflexota bacterium]
MMTVTAPGGVAIPVGLGEMQVANSGEIVAYSLGSCVAIALFDPLVKVAGMVHVVLPSAPQTGSVGLLGKYADTALPELLKQMLASGAMKHRLQCKLAGGAAVLSIGGSGSMPTIGQRNATAVKAELERARIRVQAESLGGTVGRTVRLHAETGRLLVRKVSGPEEEL